MRLTQSNEAEVSCLDHWPTFEVVKQSRTNIYVSSDDDHGHCQWHSNTFISWLILSVVDGRIGQHGILRFFHRHLSIDIRVRGPPIRWGRVNIRSTIVFEFRFACSCTTFLNYSTGPADNLAVNETKHFTEHTTDISHAEKKDRYADRRIANAAQLTFP